MLQILCGCCLHAQADVYRVAGECREIAGCCLVSTFGSTSRENSQWGSLYDSEVREQVFYFFLFEIEIQERIFLLAMTLKTLATFRVQTSGSSVLVLGVTECKQELFCGFNVRFMVLENYTVSSHSGDLSAKTYLCFKWGEEMTSHGTFAWPIGSWVLLQGCSKALYFWWGWIGRCLFHALALQITRTRSWSCHLPQEVALDEPQSRCCLLTALETA